MSIVYKGLLILSITTLFFSPLALANIMYQGKTEFNYAAIKGDIDTVNKFLNKNIDSNQTDALYNAAKHGRIAIVRLLSPLANAKKKEAALVIACETGRIEIAKHLLEANTEPNIISGKRRKSTPLIFAIRYGHIDVVSLLLQYEADPNFEANGEFPIHAAVGGNTMHTTGSIDREKIATILVEHGAYTNVRNILGYTPAQLAKLHGYDKLADALNYLQKTRSGTKDVVFKDKLFQLIDEGNVNEVKRLLDANANINTRGHWGLSPLGLAARNGNTKIVSLLLSNGAEKEPSKKFKENPLYDAIILSHPKVSQLLLSTKSAYGKSTLNKALLLSIEKNQTQIIKQLLVHGANPNTKKREKTAFVIMAENSFYYENIENMLSLFLAHGGEPYVKSLRNGSVFEVLVNNMTNKEGDSLDRKKRALKKILLSRHSLPDDQGETGLIWAVSHRAIGIAKILLESDISPNASDRYGVSALNRTFKAEKKYHVSKRSLDMFQLLLEYKASANIKQLDQIMVMALNATHDTDLIRLLLDSGLSPNHYDPSSSKNRRGMQHHTNNIINYLELAIKRGHLDTARVLLQRGVDVNRDVVSDRSNITRSLYLAAGASDTELVNMLIDAGAEVDAKNTKHGNTALFAAVPNLDNVIALINAGANINTKNKRNETPLHRAYQKGTPEVVEYLLKHGAKRFKKITPIEIAARAHNSKVLNWLLDNHTANDKVAMRNALSMVSRSNNVETLVALLKHDMLDDSGNSNYGFRLAWLQELAFIEAYISSGIDVNTTYYRNETPLMWAAERGDLGLVNLLISKGANVNATDSAGNSSLIKTVNSLFMKKQEKREHRRTIAVIGEGTNFQAEVEQAEPVYYPIDHDKIHGDIITSLLSAGANKNLKNKKGVSVVDLVKEKGDKKLQKLFNQYL